jgi:hypothetical protein
MRRLFDFYALAGPALLAPLAAWLWHRHYGARWDLAMIAISVPILHGYVVPGIGTNYLKMWSVNARLRLGRFRPQHGFVFGAATAIIALPCMGAPGNGDIAGAGLRTGAILLAVNWIYDALAIRHGIIEVYNQPWADGGTEWAITADYVPWFFGVVGLLYGAGLKLAELRPAEHAPGIFLLLGGATITLPALGYVLQSYLRHGHSGCRPFASRSRVDQAHETPEP